MAREVFCLFFKTNKPGLQALTYPKALGKHIFENISAEAWTLWIQQQTKLINENQLSLCEKSDRQRLEQAMVHFLFGEPSTID